MKIILFPTQFEPQATKSLMSACRLGHRNGARVIILATIPTPDPYQYPNADALNKALDDAYAHALSAFNQMHNAVDVRFQGNISLELHTMVGSPTICALLAAKKFEPNVILVGGSTFGSASAETRRLMRKASCPVLALPATIDMAEGPKLLYVTNFRKEDKRIVNKLLTFAKDFDGSLYCVHIKRDNGSIDYGKVQPWEKHYAAEIEAGLISFEVIYQNQIHQQLDAVWRKHKPGLWVLPMKDKRWWENLLPPAEEELDVSPANSAILGLNNK